MSARLVNISAYSRAAVIKAGIIVSSSEISMRRCVFASSMLIGSLAGAVIKVSPIPVPFPCLRTVVVARFHFLGRRETRPWSPGHRQSSRRIRLDRDVLRVIPVELQLLRHVRIEQRSLDRDL